MHRFIDNVQKKLYNEDGFYAVKQREGKNMDELNKHNIDDANIENCAPQESTENQQPTMALDADAQETEQAAEKSNAAPEMDIDKLICPRCGKAFTQKEKKCPHCGLKNNLKLCKTYGATIAKSAKHCPKCGAKNAKPIFKRVWFWILIIILIGIMLSVSKMSSNSTEPSNATIKASDERKPSTAVTSIDDIIGTWTFDCYIDYDTKEKTSANAAGNNIRLELYDDHTGVIITSTGEKSSELRWSYTKTDNDGDYMYSVGKGNALLVCTQRTAEDALDGYKGKLIILSDNAAMVFAKDENAEKSNNSENTSVSKTTSDTPKTSKVVSSKISVGKQNALRQANQYLNAMAFSYSGLIEQLEYEVYSTDDATYAVDHCGADWNDEAAKKAEEYLNTMSFSRSGLIEQLEYEGFTHDQAVYGVNKAY